MTVIILKGKKNMSKRFIDTEIWDKEKFNNCTPEIKLLSLFIFSKCDCIGVFKMAPVIINAYMGFKVSEEKIMNIPFEIMKLKDSFFLKNFCDFQYGELKKECKPHKKYISELKKIGLYNYVLKGYRKGINTLQEKEEEKDKEKEKERGKGFDFKKGFDFIWDYYPRKDGRKQSFRHFKATVKTDQDFVNIKQALKNYLFNLEKNSTEPQYIKKGSTWFNNWEDWINCPGQDYKNIIAKIKNEKAQTAQTESKKIEDNTEAVRQEIKKSLLKNYTPGQYTDEFVKKLGEKKNG